ncbi:MAG TPA: hypothetical protein VKR53_22135 [Puia sp.]|nr:hypothetical protein [Puia sp.]
MKSIGDKVIYVVLSLCIFAALSTLKVSAQTLDSTGKTIPDGKLEWNYYTGQVDYNSRYWANTNCGINYKFSIIPTFNDTVKILLHSWIVLKNDSWVLPDKKSNELLEHEQGHLDFAILCSLEFEKVVKSSTFLKINYSQKIDSLFKVTLNKYKMLEVQYDTETNHMLDRNKQAEWNKTLETMLKSQ